MKQHYIYVLFLIQGLSAIANTNTVFFKALSDGCLVEVSKTMSEEFVSSTNAPAGVPGIFVAATKYQKIQFEGSVTQGGTNRIFWKKTIRVLPIPGWGYSHHNSGILDAEIKGNTAAVLYSDRDVYLERIALDADTKDVSRVQVCVQGSLAELKTGRIFWGDSLYVVGEVQSDIISPVLFRVGPSRAEKLFPPVGLREQQPVALPSQLPTAEDPGTNSEDKK